MDGVRLRVFKKFPANKKCPICGTNKNKEGVLIPIVGTNKGTMNYEADVFHLDCINLFYDKEMNLIYQKLNEVRK